MGFYEQKGCGTHNNKKNLNHHMRMSQTLYSVDFPGKQCAHRVQPSTKKGFKQSSHTNKNGSATSKFLLVAGNPSSYEG